MISWVLGVYAGAAVAVAAAGVSGGVALDAWLQLRDLRRAGMPPSEP